MGLKVFKPGRRFSNFVKLPSARNFRDTLIVWPRHDAQILFLNSVFNNPFLNYEVISFPVANDTYQIRVASEDDLSNVNTPGADPEAFASVVVSAFTLPPINLDFTVSGNNVIFTWDHPSTGAPTTYNFYGIQNGNVIDRTTALATISGSLRTHTINLASGDWKVVLEATVGGVESENLNLAEFTTPDTAQAPPKAGLASTSEPNAEVDQTNPFAVTGLELSNVSVGKVKIRFLWLWGSLASTFNVYNNGGSGDVDLVTPADTFARQAGIVQEFTTAQLHSVDTNQLWKFVVRAENSDLVEEKNTDIYEVLVDGVAPDLIEDIALDTVL